jgi:hypothetical protein
MNLHAAVQGAISAINPFIPVVIKRAVGYTTGADGTQAPNYRVMQGSAQIQDINGTEIMRLNALGIQGDLCCAYINGNYDGIVRSEGKGGDLFCFRGQVWMVAKVMEEWSGWCRLALVLQIDSPNAIL